ncbi:MAG: dihydrolipoyl dehydrogenase family protein [Candidatus Tyrphobacter sp.]
MREFDVLVVGTGSAGNTAAMMTRSQGRSVAIVDDRAYGGTCALRGCDPKKVLVGAASIVDDATRLVPLGAVDRAPVIDWPALARFKRTFTDPVPPEREREYGAAGIVTLHGRARFDDPQTVRVGDERVRAGHVVIAAGARPRHVADGDDALLTSEQFLDLQALPGSLIFVGGGYIALEFAHVAARAGAKVTIVHAHDRVLSGFDPDVVEGLVATTREIGIELVLNAPVRAVAHVDGGIVVRATARGGQREFRAEAGVLAAGRVADIDELALDAGNVARTPRGIAVNAYLQSTSNPNVYAAGDAADGGALPLTPIAGYEGEIVAENILHGNRRTLETAGLANVVYTIPPLGTTGLTQQQARERGIDVEVHAGDMTSWYSSRRVAARGAYYKVVVETGSRTIAGATIFGPHAEEQINILALAVRAGLNADLVASTLFAYPTGASDLEYMLRS